MQPPVYGPLPPGTPLAAPAENPGGAASHDCDCHKPPFAGWPEKSTLDYAKTLIEVFVLLLALPWLAKNLILRPGLVITGAGRKVVPKAS